MSYDLVVRGGTVVTASDSFAADIGVRAGRVAAIGEALAPGTAEIAAAGLLVLPGGVDVHTHLDVEVGGVLHRRRFRVGHGGGGVRRDHHHLRLCVAVAAASR